MNESVERVVEALSDDGARSPEPDELKQYRSRHSLSTKQTAVLVGVDKRTWERYETGQLVLSKSRWFFLRLIANEIDNSKILHY